MRSSLFCMLLLLAPLTLLADEKEKNNCHDLSAWQDWEERTAKNPDDVELQTLHALWMGLCVKVEQGAIEFDQATVIFERARDALIQQRREQRHEQQQQQHKPL
jgi:hypothetical protein